MGHRLGPWLFLACLAAACSDVELSEESSAACMNGEDDDGDMLSDCADPSCDGSGACETSMDACRNGVDDDADGNTDCAEDSCVTRGFCDAMETLCSIRPQSGCTEGMGCYVRLQGTGMRVSTCRAAGAGIVGSTCSLMSLDRLGPRDRHPCRAGFGCQFLSQGLDRGMCGSYCASSNDCPTGGLCFPNTASATTPGLCTTPCDPRVTGACPSGFACVSFHERGDAYAAGGARWACVDMSLQRGQASAGMPCMDPAPAGVAPSQVCRSSLACVPLAGGGGSVCREVCDVMMPACTSGTCRQLYPGEPPSAVGNKVFGYCL